MEKQIKNIQKKQFKQNAVGFESVDMFHSEFDFEPFLVFTEFHMNRQVFGPHPHAGVSVMTYMLPDSKGSFLNRDSRGDSSIIEPGSIHVTQAGSGVHHDEVPTIDGVDCHGFQIWINHADKNRLVAPAAFHASASEVAEYSDEKTRLRVIQGSFSGINAPFELVTETSLFDVTLQPNSSLTLDAKEMAFVYLMSGEIMVQGNKISEISMVTFQTEGKNVTIETGEKSANFMFASGTPHHEPIVYGGPFVMTTQEQMHETRKRLGRGEMGELKHLWGKIVFLSRLIEPV